MPLNLMLPADSADIAALFEACIGVTNVRYIAEARMESIWIDKNELDEARWFSREELAQFGEWGDAGQGFKLTRHDSISRYLIEYWRDQNPSKL